MMMMQASSSVQQQRPLLPPLLGRSIQKSKYRTCGVCVEILRASSSAPFLVGSGIPVAYGVLGPFLRLSSKSSNEIELERLE